MCDAPESHGLFPRYGATLHFSQRAADPPTHATSAARRQFYVTSSWALAYDFTIVYCTVLYCTVLCIVRHNTIPYRTRLYNTIL